MRRSIPVNNFGSYPTSCGVVQKGHRDVARLLLDHNADVHVHDDGLGGDTPLHYAARGGHLEVARIVLERNVKVNSRNGHGSTPLLLASERGTPNIVQLLPDHNADVKCARRRWRHSTTLRSDRRPA
jgi:ankyrin repeat protein